ncbi:biotin holocarboxylase synthetase [Bulinus truncatus]|nr:biotin holocarboxylase synthetase [Bulinus truncatus]
MTTASQQKSILIYNGKGSDDDSRRMLFHSVKSVADHEKHNVTYISAQDIKEGNWVKNCQLIVFGGGYDRGFNEAVGRDGIRKIQEFVYSGGCYMGLCAGGYWACDHIEFDKDGPLEVVGERFLKFFPGQCIGPAFPGFVYNSTKGAQAAPVHFDKIGLLDAYMNGGGYFLPYQEKHKSNNSPHELWSSQCVSVITPSQRPSHSPAQPALDSHHKSHHTHAQNSWQALGVFSSLVNRPAAVVKCNIGKGCAILSGVHLEYPVKLLKEDDPHLSHCLPALSLCEEKRALVFTDLLRQLGVVVRHCKSIV